MNFSQILKSIRLTLRLTQPQMAIIINSIPNTFKYWENGRGLPTPNNMKKIETQIREYIKSYCNKSRQRAVECLLSDLSERYVREKTCGNTDISSFVKD